MSHPDDMEMGVDRQSPMKTNKWHFTIDLPPVEADTHEEAMILALDMLTDMSMCFKGAKFLRNAVPTYRGCTYNPNLTKEEHP